MELFEHILLAWLKSSYMTLTVRPRYNNIRDWSQMSSCLLVYLDIDFIINQSAIGDWQTGLQSQIYDLWVRCKISRKGFCLGFISYLHDSFQLSGINPHENLLLLLKKGDRATPLNPLWIHPWILSKENNICPTSSLKPLCLHSQTGGIIILDKQIQGVM